MENNKTISMFKNQGTTSPRFPSPLRLCVFAPLRLPTKPSASPVAHKVNLKNSNPFGFRISDFGFILLSLTLFLPLSLLAQGTRADYDRANSLEKRFRETVFKTRVIPHWLPDNQRFWFRNELSDRGREFILVDAIKGQRSTAFDHARLAAALSKLTGKSVRADQLPVEALDFSADGKVVTLRTEDRLLECSLADYALREIPDDGRLQEKLTAEYRIRPSRNGGTDSAIQFVNRTTEEVGLFWIDAGGERKPYARVKPGARSNMHTFAGHVWAAIGASNKIYGVFEAKAIPSQAVIENSRGKTNASAPTPGKPPSPKRKGNESPDGKWQITVKEHNLFLRVKNSSEDLALSKDGTEKESYSERDLFWSPDSKKLIALRTLNITERQIQMVESSPKDQLQPKLHTLNYAKPGDPLAQPRPQLFELETRRQIAVPNDQFTNCWSLSQYRWEPDSSRFTFLFNQRGHQVLRLISIDAATGKPAVLLEEKSPTFVDYAHKVDLRWLEESNEFIWMSERDGWNHLYLFDARTGQLKNQITRGSWVVRGVDRVDTKKRQLWFRAGGIRSTQDPYYIHYVRINLDGTGLTLLTEADGNHSVEYSPDQRFLLDTWSRVDAPPVHELRSAEDGHRICEVERADASGLFKAGWKAPEPFVAKGRDGSTDIYGVIFRPTNFDPTKKYPVIEDIYAGPHSAFVPKSFSPFYGSQKIAELGFIVVKIDGMGTNHRSKKFHAVAWKNLGDSGFPDRIAWMRAATARYPYIDLSRVGIYGGSAGGQSALRALLAHGDFYRAAVADCGCHDNRMDKIWWNELWMSWPIGKHYEEQSNVTQAHKLQGKLLLVVGELDKNVDPSSTMQVVNALIKADKDFEFLIVPGGGHGIAESPYGQRRRMDFFVRNLWGLEPRRELR